LAAVSGQFQVSGRFLAGETYGCGHINDTYAVTFEEGGATRRTILQRSTILSSRIPYRS